MARLKPATVTFVFRKDHAPEPTCPDAEDGRAAISPEDATAMELLRRAPLAVANDAQTRSTDDADDGDVDVLEADAP